MKTYRIPFICAVLLGLLSVQLPAKSVLEVGQPAPDFVLEDVAGKVHRLADFKGKPVVLEWINPECPVVKKHYDRSGNIPRLQSAAQEEGVVWLSINSGSPGEQGDYSPEQVVAWLSKQGANPAAYLRDPTGKVGRLYGARTTPHMFVIGPSGNLVYQGAIDSIRSGNAADIAKAENYVTAALAAIKSGTLPAKTSSQPYGCAIKY